MKDAKPYEEYFRFEPQGGEARAHTPFTGDVEAGRIYAINQPQTVAILSGHPDWESATKKDYQAQLKADAQAQEESDEE